MISDKLFRASADKFHCTPRRELSAKTVDVESRPKTRHVEAAQWRALVGSRADRAQGFTSGEAGRIGVFLRGQERGIDDVEIEGEVQFVNAFGDRPQRLAHAVDYAAFLDVLHGPVANAQFVGDSVPHHCVA